MEPVDIFVPTLNNNQIQETLKWLLSQYQESDSCHDNRVLFESIYLLYNLGNSEALRHYLQLEKRLRFVLTRTGLPVMQVHRWAFIPALMA